MKSLSQISITNLVFVHSIINFQHLYSKPKSNKSSKIDYYTLGLFLDQIYWFEQKNLFLI
ncbi:hypothetical protein BWZ22_05815 [Seonamhaeicola sp. S2-3]|uniref:hypothetical protein n=1 Tax=Seonamhaeicola sp. S2-3 TaxID=1936081 RepID=UPI000972A5CA|nr:hypothetical protein [Seonamhaeicola sp. S2-3]APY10785.1 hypothetical protein BWZ22_05815 [Seonamhaeicola sp. S2-3]